MASLLLTTVLMAVGGFGPPTQNLEGVVVNGSQGNKPVPSAEVVLRAGKEGALNVIATTTADSQGRFSFRDLPIEPSVVWIPGANHRGIHYPGPRFTPLFGRPYQSLQLVIYETIEQPSPLKAEHFYLDLRIAPPVVEITESWQIVNDSTTTYIGQTTDGKAGTTLSLNIPKGFDRVTFNSEFHGRRFRIQDQQVVTDVPFPPGRREIKYTYRLPVEDFSKSFARTLDLPCTNVRVHLAGEGAKSISSNLPRREEKSEDVVFESKDELAAGSMVMLALNGFSFNWLSLARWTALIVVCGLIGGTGYYRFRPKLQSAQSSSPPIPARVRTRKDGKGDRLRPRDKSRSSRVRHG